MLFNDHIGLFTADQNLKGDTARFTRQNANGNRRGLEVPEERDYYPYWGPTPWIDMAIMVSNKKTESLMKEHVKSRDLYEKWKLVIEKLERFESVLYFPCAIPGRTSGRTSAGY